MNNPYTLRSLQLKVIVGHAIILCLFIFVLIFLFIEKMKMAVKTSLKLLTQKLA